MKKIILAIILIILILTGCDSSDYKKAVTLYEEGNYSEAAVIFAGLGDYEDSAEWYNKSKYQEANQLFKAGDYEEAIEIYELIIDYKDSDSKIEEAETEIMYETYAEVFSSLSDSFWYFNGGSDTVLNKISFTKEEATVAQVYFDGNGKHDNGSNSFAYTVDDKNITLEMNGTELVLDYTVEGGKVSLEQGVYFTELQILEGLQGAWNCSENEYSSIWGRYMYAEDNIIISGNHIEYENINESARHREGSGVYYYFGPYEGDFTLNFGGIDSEMDHDNEIFFNVVDGEVVLIHWDDIFDRSDITKLPGQNGYKIK